MEWDQIFGKNFVVHGHTKIKGLKFKKFRITLSGALMFSSQKIYCTVVEKVHCLPKLQYSTVLIA